MILPQERLLPQDPAYPRGHAKLRAIRRLAEATHDLARRAAAGRVLYFQGYTPQYLSRSIEAVAWHRESGACPGYRNRSFRRYEKGLTKTISAPTMGAQ